MIKHLLRISLLSITILFSTPISAQWHDLPDIPNPWDYGWVGVKINHTTNPPTYSPITVDFEFHRIKDGNQTSVIIDRRRQPHAGIFYDRYAFGSTEVWCENKASGLCKICSQFNNAHTQVLKQYLIARQKIHGAAIVPWRSSFEFYMYFNDGTGTVTSGSFSYPCPTCPDCPDPEPCPPCPDVHPEPSSMTVRGNVRSSAFAVELEVDARGMGPSATGQVKYVRDSGAWFEGTVDHICTAPTAPNQVGLTGEIIASSDPSKKYFRIQIQDRKLSADRFRVGWSAQRAECELLGKFPAITTKGDFEITR